VFGLSLGVSRSISRDIRATRADPATWSLPPMTSHQADDVTRSRISDVPGDLTWM